MNMKKLQLLKCIKEIYKDEKNIIEYLKNIDGSISNSKEDILISYDFQAGSYSHRYSNNPSIRDEYCKCLADVLKNIGCDYNYSICEVGVGEATTLGPLFKYLLPSQQVFGFDLSWSRIKYANRFIKDFGIEQASLFVADLFCTPFADNSIDFVYSSESIEPNTGREREALIELYRIARKYLVLLEPSYEFANDEARKRMIKHGYVTSLYKQAMELGYNVIEHRLFDVSFNPLNPKGLIIIKKDEASAKENGKLNGQPKLCCPITKTELKLIKNCYYSKDSMLAYPVIVNVPCLMPENAIIATKFLD